jgi:ribosomal protein S12 methylthiotransferase accessory factor
VGGLGHRVQSASETWDRIAPVLAGMGVTRIADLTGLDRLGVPVFDAIMPRSRDTISTYGGKGLTPINARVSAVMEAVERYCAARPRRPDHYGSILELRARGVNVLDPREINLALHPSYTDETPIEWVWGYDIASDHPTLVSLHQAGDCWPTPGQPVNEVATSNGLASGNNEAEAVVHGLNEVIERDARTLAELLTARLAPVVHAASGGALRLSRSVLAPLDLAGVSDQVQELVQHFAVHGVDLDLCAIRSDLRIPTVIATTIDRDGAGLSVSHEGMGTDADPETAVIRALTEVAQSRAGDVSGAREDMSLATEVVPSALRHTQRAAAPPRRIYAEPPCGIDELDGFASDDIVADLVETVRRLRHVGLDRVIVVDLSEELIPAAVCRVLVPGAESWGADRSLLGSRALRAWNAALGDLTATGGDSAA